MGRLLKLFKKRFCFNVRVRVIRIDRVRVVINFRFSIRLCTPSFGARQLRFSNIARLLVHIHIAFCRTYVSYDGDDVFAGQRNLKC